MDLSHLNLAVQENLMVKSVQKRHGRVFKGQEWKIGHPDICGWNPKDLTALLPITILNAP